MEHRGQEHAVGRGQRGREVGGELTAARAQAARLEEGHQPMAGESLPERRQRRRDLRGVMGEVVDDDDASRLADDFEPPLHAPERGEGIEDGVPFQPVGARRRPHRRRVQRVVLAPDAEVDPLAAGRVFHLERDPALAALDRTDEPDVGGRGSPASGRPRASDPGARPRAARTVASRGCQVWRGWRRGARIEAGAPDSPAVGHDPARARRQQPLHGRIVGAGDEQSSGVPGAALARRQPLDQSEERPLQALEVRVQIDVVVLQAGQDDGLRPVVPELRSAIEVGGVVLVALDDEPRAVAERES